jgi:hypothetical protein
MAVTVGGYGAAVQAAGQKAPGELLSLTEDSRAAAGGSIGRLHAAEIAASR